MHKVMAYRGHRQQEEQPDTVLLTCTEARFEADEHKECMHTPIQLTSLSGLGLAKLAALTQ